MMPKSHSKKSSVSITKEQSSATNKSNSNLTRSGSTWKNEELAKVRQRVIEGHKGGVNSVQFCYDDTKILSGSTDGTARLWNFETGIEENCYKVHDKRVTAARMSRNNNTRFVTGGWDKKVHMWDVETGQCIWTGEHDGIVSCVAVSNDGNHVVSASDLDLTLKVWDAGTGQVVQTIKDLHTSTLTSCIFSSSDDRIITTSMDMTTKFWDLKTAANTLTLGGHINIISSSDITRDGRRFATCSWDKSVQLWDIATGSYRSQGPSTLFKYHEGCISSCHFCPDGSMLVTAGYDMNIVIWDVENSIHKLKLQGHEDWIEDVRFNENQDWLVSGSKDTCIRLWNLEEADMIPAVLETKKSLGLKILTCTNCKKPFSIQTVEDSRTTICVFCRMEQRQYAIIDYTSDSQTSSATPSAAPSPPATD